MKHVRFTLLLVVALCVALPLSIVFSMNECQLNTDAVAVEECFRNAERGGRIYLATIVVSLLLAVGLHIVAPRWTWIGLLIVAFGPWLTVFI